MQGSQFGTLVDTSATHQRVVQHPRGSLLEPALPSDRGPNRVHTSSRFVILVPEFNQVDETARGVISMKSALTAMLETMSPSISHPKVCSILASETREVTTAL